MAVECKVICGNKEATIKIKRPSFKSVRKAYREINSKDIATRYEMVSKALLKAHQSGLSGYQNTCALQVSYALNKSQMFIEQYLAREVKKQPQGIEDNSIALGDDGHNYIIIIRVETLNKFLMLQNVWGNADESYNPKRMQTKQENINFYNNEFSKFSKNGVVAMIISGWSDASGHITLWDGEEKEFLDNSNYLMQLDCIVKELYFWELK
ncbi:type VI secretion system amidase effector protein Tae4 [Helicobacter sp. MIT 14-3879]|uniref:type VI secretion system amidase effector protein Tae4 n=1 Tax=Helicobacter sp. MIT 14-3879 TaxID=2040649 RepID=UPI000E1EA84A|nr:type VI secretion system amidase effector protein Tae4 [Helicobacter sp. MIT 14-3879]RDU59296.1 hypothetical protein CQA44_11565 [Helicobacter sp. MIT 14-3879]